jgi:hypothetical protein
MPIRYERDDASRRVVVTVEGPFAVADFLAVIERQRGDGSWTYGMLYDLRGMTGEPAIDDLRQFMSEAERTTQPRGPIGDPGHRSGHLRSGLHVCGTHTRHADDRGLSRLGRGRAVADGSGDGDGERRGVMVGWREYLGWDEEVEQLETRVKERLGPLGGA